MKLIGNKKGILLATFDYYWSSTEDNSYYAYSVGAYNGVVDLNIKEYTTYIRPFVHLS